MKVYAIKPHDSYQSLLPVDYDTYRRITGKWGFDGQSKRTAWETLECEASDPVLPRGDFLAVTLGAFACSSRAEDALRDLYLAVGELLPIKVEGQTLSIVNLTRFVDAIDLILCPGTLVGNV